MPNSLKIRTTSPLERSRLTPRASRQSAEPEADDDALFPCLTTGMPAAAMTSAAMVEMLTVWSLSPPVPTMSRTSPSTSTGRACETMASAIPRISVGVSPLAARAVRNPASWADVAAPSIAWSTAQAASSRVKSRPPTSRLMTSGHVGSDTISPRCSTARRPPPKALAD